MTLTWKKCASVTKGGKPYFWFQQDHMAWVVWDRDQNGWIVQYKGKQHGPYPTDVEGKKAATQLIERKMR